MKKGHPLGKKNVKRSPEEKEQLVLEYLKGTTGYKSIARLHNISSRLMHTWIEQYQAHGIEGLKSKTGKHKNPNAGRHNRRLSEVDILKEKLLNKEIEIERLKKVIK